MASAASLMGGARGAAAMLVTGAVLAACGTPAAQKAAAPAGAPSATPPAMESRPPVAAVATDTPLAGTSWRLVEIQSMDDAIGTTRVPDAAHSTMRLNDDGSVVVRLSCNSATGTWSADAGTDRSSGRFEFGPLTATGAPCATPSVDEQVTRQAPYFRSYLLKDGRLYLSLIADGGIFVWESAGPAHGIGAGLR
jgi:hypothetical protein